MKGVLAVITVMSLAVMPFLPAMALDHTNLDENRPLRLQDAYPVAQGEFVVEAGGGYSWNRGSSNRGFFPVQFVYGILPNAQVELGTTFLTSPGGVEGPGKSGDITLGGLYNFNQETVTLPAFALKGAVQFPSGVDSSGTEGEITAIITKSFHRLTLSLNGGYQFISRQNSDDRNGRYRFVFGGGYPVGAPMHTRTVLLSDFFIEQSSRRGEAQITGGELGLRHQVRERIVFDIGVGSEFSGPSDRSRFYVNVGFSIGF